MCENMSSTLIIYIYNVYRYIIMKLPDTCETVKYTCMYNLQDILQKSNATTVCTLYNSR